VLFASCRNPWFQFQPDDDGTVEADLPTYAVTVTVTFNGNGSTGGTAPAAMTSNAGAIITLPAQGTLEKDGCSFDGWNTEADGTGTTYNAHSAYTVTADITLYAKWELGEKPTYIGNLTVEPIPAQTYTGSPITPTVTVSDGSTTLTLTTDYTVEYTNNINAGTANVTITGAGNYAGSTGSTTFTINKADGATVPAPTAATIGEDSVTLNSVSASTGQTVEYARNTTDTAPSNGWQTGTTFDGLTADTTYYSPPQPPQQSARTALL